MQVKVIKHQVRDNLFAISSDLYKMLNRKGEHRDYLNGMFVNDAVITEDKYLPDMTILVPDREYFDKKIDTALADWEWFTETYLKK